MSDDELSDSARAALEIQNEIDTGDVKEKKEKKDSRKSNGTHGAITGIALGEYAHGASRKGSNEVAHIKMKGGKANSMFSESLESLAYRQDSDEEVKLKSRLYSY